MFRHINNFMPYVIHLAFIIMFLMWGNLNMVYMAVGSVIVMVMVDLNIHRKWIGKDEEAEKLDSRSWPF